MKKLISLFLLALTVGLLAACGGETDENEIKVGATSVPHAEILEEVKPILAEEGITLTIETYTDYALPNEDLSRGELDANYFQHIPFFELSKTDHGYDLVNIGGIHVEPLGVFSKDIPSIDVIAEGTEVIISRSVPDHGRILALFEANGFITLADDVDKSAATIDDIVDNPLNLTFSPSVNPEFLIEAYENESNTLIAINGNYAIDAGLSPVDDALFYEGADSLYVNIIAARAEDEDNENLQKLVEVLQSEEITNFINEKYKGEVVPVGGAE
ncbi:lipoprotein [Halolactibacillus alkaliphilus]|uniref:Lipoprotein n=1 Tax=Halolactibacillus alkaliphilus TaxID=442899 RepID=A0A511X358_9BACI|nr:MetQ/NlpA family ABC transporter substrate-binding protein [Halolactibacillus alkaliphilus]GEN57355.1 lipoprotein [Halolactibacillus alkaliphilus]GGN73091.1 lipoprotein [Halolactibacillus alkaliphilus]SFO94365.1 D-methionine transport system substrate-binding protein [Halolactibacillus alkaliphilus]